MNPPQELFDYMSRFDASFEWHLIGMLHREQVTVYELKLTSQTWQGLIWTHLLQVFVPKPIPQHGAALLYVTADSSMKVTELGCLLAVEAEMICAVLYDIPNQPLFDDLIEDALIAHSFVQYLDTLDPTWPLLFPMTRAVARAMDALQVFGGEVGYSADRFIVSGMSKRGWTTWFSAVVDERVDSIIPMVYDNLNIPAQMPHQLEVGGDYSDQISDYTRAGLPQRMNTPDGMRLTLMVDPYTYRSRLQQPRLIINSANDPYWMTDSLNLYLQDLPGETRLLYIPNVGHSLNDPQRLYTAVTAFLKARARRRLLPEPKWTFTSLPTGVRLELEVAGPATGARCWIAHSTGRDFRGSLWNENPMIPVVQPIVQQDGATMRWAVELPAPMSGSRALFGEVELKESGVPFTLSTQIHIDTTIEGKNRREEV